MIKIKKAAIVDVDVLALLGRLTYLESHGHFIEDKNDLLKYVNDAFSVAKTKQDIINSDRHFYIIYVDELPVGYAKLVLNGLDINLKTHKSCQLERIYILNAFIPYKVGQILLTYVEAIVKKLEIDTISLSVYTKNKRAIRFYEKNEYKAVGETNFLVNGKNYENLVFLKNI